MTKRTYPSESQLSTALTISLCTHVLWPPEGDTGNTGDLLQAKRDESLPGFAFRARLDFIESSLGGGVLFVIVIVVMVVVVVVVVVVVTLMVRVVRVDLLNAGRHL